MPYIGKQLVRGQNRKLDDISSGFNGSQPTFTLQVASQNVTVGSALQLWISLGGVIQEPTIDYTVAGNQITFTTPPAASLDFFGVIQGDVTDTNTPGDATVTTSKLATGLTVNLADGSAATSSLQLGGTDSGLFSSAADKVNVTTGGVERLEIGDSEVVFNDPSNDVDFRVESNGNTHMLFVDGGNDRVGVGVSSPSTLLDVESASDQTVLRLRNNGGNDTRLLFSNKAAGLGEIFYQGDFRFVDDENSDAERLRIDSSGRLLVGTSSSTQYPFSATARASQVQIKGALSGSDHNGSLSVDCTNNGGLLILANSQDVTTSGRNLGLIGFNGYDGSDNRAAASISCEADATTGSNDMPGRLVFSTTADGASSPTERMRIDSSGNVGIGTTSPSTKLHIASTAAGGDIHVTNASGQNCLLEMAGNGNTIGSGNALYGQDASSNVYAGWARGAHPVLFATGNTERMRIDSSGRLLVGTSSSFQMGRIGAIQVAGGTGAGANNAFISATRFGTTSGGGELTLAASYGSNGNHGLVPNGHQLGLIGFVGSDGAAGKYAATIKANVDGTSGTNDMPGRLSFSTTADGASSPTERMRINKTGTVQIGDLGTVPTGTHRIKASSSNDNEGALRVDNTNTAAAACAAAFVTATNSTATSNALVKFGMNSYNSGSGQINANGSSQAAFGTFSDERLKENITSLPSQWDNIKNLRPVEFDYIESQGGGHQIGFIAQEFETVYADAVGSSPMFTGSDEQSDEERLTITGWAKTEARLVKALQEAIAKIETLEAKVAALEAE